MAAPTPKTLTLDEARAALRDVIAAFDEPANAEKMNEAKAAAGSDVAKMMASVLPLAMQIQQGVITKYGFAATQPGVMQFIFAIQAHQGDAEVKTMSDDLKGRYMPKPAAA
eukprot:ANDGO_04375.mRNA.1 hypothetical protein GUITHDRAFT_151036